MKKEICSYEKKENSPYQHLATASEESRLLLMLLFTASAGGGSAGAAAATGGTGSIRQSSSCSSWLSRSVASPADEDDDGMPPRLTSCVVDALRPNPLNPGSFRRLLLASEGAAADCAARPRRESAFPTSREIFSIGETIFF